MRENTQRLVSEKVVNAVAEKFGIKLAQRLESLDDYTLLQVYNCCCSERYINRKIFIDIEDIAELWKKDQLGLAKAVAFGDGADCFDVFNWLTVDSYGWIKAIKPSNRREMMLSDLCNLWVSVSDVQGALNYCIDHDY